MALPWLIPRNQLQVIESIGGGSFGEVTRARWNLTPQTSRDVAIKKLLPTGNMTGYAWSEINKMQRFDHHNVLKLVGISSPDQDSNDPWIITDFQMNGDLHQYILNHAPNLTTAQMTNFAHGVASGMEYLHHTLQPPVLHGDLAARNCFVGQNSLIKIGDFGKINDYYSEDYYSDHCGHDEGNEMDECDHACLPCPIRWMPPENLPNQEGGPRCTRKGDVWAFGVVLFEIWTRARLPFEEMNNDEVIEALDAGKTPGTEYNVLAVGHILELMDDCWDWDAETRPNFREIRARLEN